ncbi:MAG: methyl-accepting chemotaxis protein [Pararhodobacter sp.]
MFKKLALLFSRRKPQREASLADTFLSVIDRTQATIEFKPDGTILAANQNFLDVMGYTLAEITGRHHAIFVRPDQVSSPAYRDFWASLASGTSFTDRFARVAKDGSTVWIQATYAPYVDHKGKVTKIIKIANDITERQIEIEAIADALKHQSKGDLTYRVPVSRLPDIAALGTAFNTAQDQLSQTIGAVKDVAVTVETLSTRLGRASSELSQRTETQAATLEETAAALEEITATVRTAASGAREVENSVAATKRTAESGGRVVTDAIEAMSLIEGSSRKIAQIINVIDDIAFQTNLLALNAGVEAARAGEAGRGFAVVASEVRALAQRASDAAKEIKGLIEEGSGHVRTGVGMVGQAGDELRKIISGVEAIYGHMSSISSGAAEQALSLNEISSGVSQLDAVTQKNASMVDETTEASRKLASDAGELSRQVSIFRTQSHPPAPVIRLAETGERRMAGAAR